MLQKIGLIVTELASFFTARFIPVVRHAISIPAGITKMPLLRFTTLTALAIIPWSIIFIYLGEKLGENWENINDIVVRM